MFALHKGENMIRKTKKPFIYLLAAMVYFVLFCSFMPTTAFAAEGDTGTTDIWKWREREDGTLSITGCTTPTGDLTLPASLDMRAVTRIENNAFDKCYGLTSIDMSGCNSLTSIGDYAFRGNSNLYPCSNLKTVIMPDSVTSVGKEVFYFCDNLTSVTLSSNLENIGDSMFYNCRKLTSITIPGSVTSIGLAAFKYSALTGIAIPNSVTSIGDAAFSNCSSLVSATLPDNVSFTGIPKDLFSEDYNLTTANISSLSHVTSIGSSAFFNTALESIIIPDSVTTIGNCAFQGCASLESVTLPTNAGFTGIPDYAFYGCTTLTSITIPESVTSIGQHVFEECSALTAINVDAANAYFSSQDGVLYNAGKTHLICHPAARSGSFDIPISVTSIGDYAFAGSSCLTGVSIPDGVTSIGDYAFFNCKNPELTEIIIPGSVTSIGEHAFEWCSSLTKITIPGGITSIGDSTFCNCEDLSEITLPESIKSIGNYAFSTCEGLTEITIPKNVTSIGDCAFLYCTDLTEITMPECVESIGSNVFYICTSLAKVIILNDSISFGINVFKLTAISNDGIYGFDGSTAQAYALAQKPVIPFHLLYTVSFSTGEGSAVSDIIAVAGDKITAPAAPTNSGYDFGGWFKDEDFTTVWDFDNDTVTDDIILYAQWTPVPPDAPVITPNGGAITASQAISISAPSGSSVSDSVYYNLNGSMPTLQSYLYTAPFTLSRSATVTAAVYNGSTGLWGTPASAAFTVTSGIPGSATVSVAANPPAGGAVSGGGTYNEGDTVTVTASVYSGYNFINWTENNVQVSTNPTYTFNMGTADRTLTANFSATTSTSGGSGGGGNPLPLPQPVSSAGGTATVDPAAGGTVSIGSEVTLNIPANALQGNNSAQVAIQQVDATAAPAGFLMLGTVYQCNVNGQDHYSFNQPVTLTFTFDPSKLAPGQTPAVYYYDDTRGQWVNIGGTVSGNTITVTVDHFTQYAVLAKEATSPPEPKPAAALTDIAGHWAEKNIKDLVSLGAIRGYPDGTFKPDSSITRAEFTAILVKVFKLQGKGEKAFADTTGHWAGDVIATAESCGIISGYNQNTFGPDDPVTREQMAVMTVKAAKLSPASGELAFTDNKEIASWAYDSILTAVKDGIIKGYQDRTFRPGGKATRAEAVTMIVNALE